MAVAIATPVCLHHEQVVKAARRPARPVREADGARSVHLLGYSQAPATEPCRMMLYQENGRRITDETQYPYSVIDVELASAGRNKRELDHFRDAVLDGTPLLVTGQDGRAAMEVIIAGYLSAYSGEQVRLPLTDEPDLEHLFIELKEYVAH